MVLGAGPAGLAAGYELARLGLRPLVLERSAEVGGLMRSIERGPFVVDVGRKELYSRIPEVDQLWKDLLGDDYRPYEHREGLLYRGRILETEDRWRGRGRGMGAGQLARGALEMAWARLPRPGRRPPQNYEEWWYRQRGRFLSRVMAQGFDEKFTGVPWRERAVPERSPTASPTESQRVWRHPARGTGQICGALRDGIERSGGEVRCGVEVLSMRTRERRIVAVQTREEGAERWIEAGNVVSTVPIEVLGPWLGETAPTRVAQGQAAETRDARARATVLVYLFYGEPPRFPHAWLRVTCPDMRAGRITSYAAFGGEMVPEGSTALCVEYFCDAGDPLLDVDTAELCGFAQSECLAAGLVPATPADAFALVLPAANAATSWRDWLTPERQRLLARTREFDNLFDAQRPGTDKAMAAGLEAALAIDRGDRTRFDERVPADRMEVGGEA